MTSTSSALVQVADTILNRIHDLLAAEISKKGRKYKYVNNNFQRIREEDKHLVIHPEHPENHVAVASAYSILALVHPDIFATHRELCLIIVGVARALETNRWYEEENSSVIHFASLKGAPDAAETRAAVAFAAASSPLHLARGYVLLYCAKLNFLHTDHHIGTRLEGVHMRRYVEEYFGADALELPEVLAALKSFVHWANIKGILWKLHVPNMDVDDALRERFVAFPDPPEELVEHALERFPLGTSKYSLLIKALEVIADSKYACLVPYPTGPVGELAWLYDLAREIEADPIRFHLRARAKRLSLDPVNLQELSQRHHERLEGLLLAVSLVLSVFPDTGGDYLLQNSKLPRFSDQLVSKHSEYYSRLLLANDTIEEYELRGWAEQDIVLRLYDSEMVNFRDAVHGERQCD